MTISLDDNKILLSGASPFLYLFDLNQGEDYEYFRLPKSLSSVRDIVFLRGGKFLVLEEGVLYLLNPQQENRVLFTKTLPRKVPIASFAINAQNKFLLLAAETGEVYLFDFKKLLNIADRLIFKRQEGDISTEFIDQPAINDFDFHHQEYKTKQNENRNALRKQRHSLSRNKDDPLISLIEDSQPVEYYQSIGSRSAEKRQKEALFSPERREKFTHKELDQRTYENHYNSRENLSESAEKKIQGGSVDSLENISHSEIQRNNNQNYLLDLQNLSKPVLSNWLNRHIVFPASQRAQIWQFLLELPFNMKAFKTLQGKGIHPASNSFFSEHSRLKVNENARDFFSYLAHYNESLLNFSFLPDLIFPFARVFGDEKILCFEIILSFLVHWYQQLIQISSGLPILLLESIEKILEYHEPYLYEHLRRLIGDGNYLTEQIIWGLIKKGFSDILIQEDWFALMDFFVLNRNNPKYFLYFVVSYLSFFKDDLLDERDKETLLNEAYFINKKSAVEISEIIQKMKTYAQKTPTSEISITFYNQLPLQYGQYPLLEFYSCEEKEHYQNMGKYLVTAERKREERKEELKEVYNRLEGIKQMEETFKTKQQPRSHKKRELREAMIRKEEEELKKKMIMEQELMNKRLERVKQMEDDMRKCLDKQEQMRVQMQVEMEREKNIKRQIQEERVELKMKEEELKQNELRIRQKENDLLDLKQEQEMEREEGLDVKLKDTENELKDTMIHEKFREQQGEYQFRTDLRRKNKKYQEMYTIENEKRREKRVEGMAEEFEKELERIEIDRVNRLMQIKYNALEYHKIISGSVEFARSFEAGRKRNRKGDDIVTKSFQIDNSRNNREDKIVKRRERMRLLGEERESLQKDLEESRKRLDELNVEKRRKDEIRRIMGIKKTEDRSFLEEAGAYNKYGRTEEERNEFQKQYLNMDYMEQEKKNFERTLKETEERILEQDKLNFVHLREATRRQMISFDDGMRRSAGSGRNNSFDLSKEEDQARKYMSIKEDRFDERDRSGKKKVNRSQDEIRINQQGERSYEDENIIKNNGEWREGRRNSRNEDRIRTIDTFETGNFTGRRFMKNENN